MKIAHIAPPWLPIPPKNYGGTEACLANLIEEQVAQGHDVTLCATADARTPARLISFLPQALAEADIPWHAHLQAFYHTYKSVEYVKTQQFDILHTHLSSTSDMYLFPLLHDLETPHIMTLHSRFPFDRVDDWTGDGDKYYMQWAARVPIVTISKHALKDVPYKLNFVDVIHHGLPMQQFAPTAEQPEDFFVWLGRIVHDKGTRLAIEAAKKASVPLVLAGTVDQHDPEQQQYFEDEIQPCIDNQQIKYIGPVDLEQKVDLLSRAKGFLNPIEWEEPFGLVMIEAMAVGCPVITFAHGAATEIIKDGTNGFLVKDVDEMVQAMAKIDKLKRTDVRAYAEEHFSIATMARKYLKVYEKVRLRNPRNN